MLIPKSLLLNNVARYITPQTIFFESMGQLVQIDAENKMSGGSSGSGKSAIFHSFAYNLGINDLPVTVLQSRFTKEGIYTEGHYDWNGQDVIIVRGKGKLSISINGEVITSSKLVEEKIDEIMGMSRDLFRKILYKKQKEGGFFLNFTPKEMHEFLTSVLGLEKYAKDLAQVDADLKLLYKTKEKADLDLKTSKSALSATLDAIVALGIAPVRDMHQNVVMELKTKYDAATASLRKLEGDHLEQITLLHDQRPVLSPPPNTPKPSFVVSANYDTTLLDTFSAKVTSLMGEIRSIEETEKDRRLGIVQKIQSLKLEISSLRHKVTQGDAGKEQATALAAEIKKIRECKCPTCEQDWVTEAAKVQENKLIEKIMLIRAQMQAGDEAKNTILAYEKEILVIEPESEVRILPEIALKQQEIVELQQKITQERANMALFQQSVTEENKRLMDAWEASNREAMAKYQAEAEKVNAEYAEKQNAIRQTHTLEITAVRGQAEVDRRAFEAALNKLQAYEAASTRYNNTLNTLKAQETQNQDKVNAAQAEFIATELKIATAEEAYRGIKSFMSCSFDEALDEIGEEATATIRAIPNMANATIQFQGTRETGDGKIKEQVNAVISLDGEEGIDIRSLSGGERSSADLAIDLAVINLIENRSNKGVSLFILDEPFTGLDSVSVEMVLELLKNTKTTKKLIIVDHNPEVKQMVESRIMVIRDGLTSTITQAA